MNDNDKDDLVLEVLLTARAEVAPDLDEKLLRQCYEIQRHFQFSQAREQSSTAMERLIDDAVNSMSAGEEK